MKASASSSMSEEEQLAGSRRASKRRKNDDKGTVVSGYSVYIQPSRAQMRQLLDFDNTCAQQFMRVPIRQCKSQEPPDQPGATSLSKACMDDLFNEIRDMWQKCCTIFEVFNDPDQPHLGYRLRVAEKLPMKLNVKENDRLTVGWKVVSPKDGPSCHLYQRSCIEEANQYLGGPISYCNWSMDQTVSVRQVNHGPWSHLVRAEIKNKAAGTELVWNYGQTRRDREFDESIWFNPECCDVNCTPMKPIRLLQSEVYQERCVLCGLTYRSMHRNATKRNAQKKVHFIQFHSNFLGSDWDGYGNFDINIHPVDVKCAQLEAERLNRLLARMKKSNWNVVPACRVLNNEDLTLGKEEALKKFRLACDHLKKHGSVVLRGRQTPTLFEDLNPVSCMSWSNVFSPGVKKTYAMQPSQLQAHEEELKNWEIQDAMMVLNLDPNPDHIEEDI